jgi:hypothetical protein
LEAAGRAGRSKQEEKPSSHDGALPSVTIGAVSAVGKRQTGRMSLVCDLSGRIHT